MFNNISWQGYWTSIAIFTAGYYLSIYLLYFRRDFGILFPSGLSRGEEHSFDFGSSTKSNKTAISESEEFQTPDTDSQEAIVYACIDELDAFFNECKKSKCLKEEMISSIQAILKKYPSLKASGYKASLTNVIVGQCEHICSIHFKADDVDRVWFG